MDLNELIKKLIGDRSFRQTSIDSGVANSYISGIINGKYKPSIKILQKLTAPEANPQNGVTLEDLMVAAGYQEDYVQKNNISWEQIKELAEMCVKNGNDFSLMLNADGDLSIDISKHDYTITPITTNPIVTYGDNMVVSGTDIPINYA